MSLLRSGFVFVIFVALAALASAGVQDGTSWTNLDGGTVTFSGRGTVMGTTACSVADGYGESSEVQGTPTSGGCGGETEESQEMTTHEEDANGNPTGNSETYRAHNGRAQQEAADGSWKNLKAARGIQPYNGPGGGCDNATPGPPGGGVGATTAPKPSTNGDTAGSHPDA